jgi:DNA mismatch repair ATPase MutS
VVSNAALSIVTEATTIGLTSIKNDLSFKKDSIVCVVEGRGNAQDEIGFAAFDKSSSTFIVSQYLDDLNYSRTINKIEYFEPNEVVMLKKSAYVKSDLMYQLSERYRSLSKF